MLLSLLLLCAAEAGAEPNADSAANDSAKAARELEALTAEIEQIRATVAQQQAEQSRQQQQVETLDRQLAELAADSYQREQRSRALERRQAELQRQRTELDAKISHERQGLNARLRALYQMQGRSQVAEWLAEKNPLDAQRNVVALNTINTDTITRLNQLAELQRQREATATEVDSNQQQLQTELAGLKAQQRALTNSRQQRQQLLAKLGSDLDTQQQLETARVADQAALQELIASLAANAKVQAAARAAALAAEKRATKLAGVKSFAAAKGKLPWPAEGRQRKLFGKTQAGSGRVWQGMTIEADAGQPVQAIYPGTVIFADYLPNQGLLLIIDHGDGYWSLYGRNESLLRQVGDFVDSGETIATIGASGGYLDTALYFEIRQRGKPQNPSKWCG